MEERKEAPKDVDNQFIIQQSSCNVETLTMERFSAGLCQPLFSFYNPKNFWNSCIL